MIDLPPYVQSVYDCLLSSPGLTDGHPPQAASLRRIATLTGQRHQTISCAIERHSSDSLAFEGRHDLFYSVYGKGRGVWGIRQVPKPRVTIRQMPKLRVEPPVWVEGYWVEGHWRAENLESLAQPDTIAQLHILQQLAVIISKNDPKIGIHINLYQKAV